MKIILILIVGITVVHDALLSQDSRDQSWKMAKEKNGITIFTRDSEASRVKEVSAQTYFDTNLTTLVAVFLDIPSYPDWVRYCKLSKLLDQTGPQDLYYYSEFKVPFPFDNRDLIQYLNIQQHPESREVTVTLSNQPSLIPEVKDIVRMRLCEGHQEDAHCRPRACIGCSNLPASCNQDGDARTNQARLALPLGDRDGPMSRRE